MGELAEQQHDHHCWLTCGGLDWRIIRQRGLLIDVVGTETLATLDLSKVDMEAYSRQAALWDKLMY